MKYHKIEQSDISLHVIATYATSAICSMDAMKSLVERGAIFVPIAIPLVCR